MKKQLPNHYYDGDVRAKMAVMAVVSLLPILGLVAGIGLLIYDWKLGLAIFTAAALVQKPLMELNIKKNLEWGRFKAGAAGGTRVLYGDIESLEHADKFQLTPDDYGGIYCNGSDMILGSLEGERRCPIQEFTMEIVPKGKTIAYLHITMGTHEFAFTPKWDGSLKEQVIGPEKAAWGASEIEKMANSVEP